MSPTYLVLGGSGFIGTHLIDRLVNSGVRVVAVDLLPPRKLVDGVDYRRHDVRDMSKLDLPQGVERIYNFAAIHTTPGHATAEYYDTNIRGAIETVALAERYGIQEIVFTSSISVYGPSERTKTEDDAPRPVIPYGHSKILAEEIHRSWLSGAQTRRLVIARPAVVFGPGERGNFTRLAALLKKGFFVYPGRETTVKACIYVEDLLSSLDYAVGLGRRYVIYNAAYANKYTLKDIVETFKAQYFPKIKTFKLPYSAMKFVASVLRYSGASRFGFHPDRVEKLVRSTDIYPKWLVSEGVVFPDGLSRGLQRWSEQTGGRFD